VRDVKYARYPQNDKSGSKTQEHRNSPAIDAFEGFCGGFCFGPGPKLNFLTFLNSKLNRWDSILIGSIFALALFWAGLPSFDNFTSQQALVDREDTAVVLGPFLQTLKSTPAFMREEVAVMRQEGDVAMMAEDWLAAASEIDAVLQASSAMQP
jgi:hypothetical protein